MAGIYIHIPFCKQACYYCDFHFSTRLDNRRKMVESIAKELSIRKEYLSNDIVSTIYLGGGTPSLLEPDEISSLLESIQKNFQVDATTEITLEANPDDLSRKKLQELRNVGINRLSIGIQSFDNNILRFLHRAHDAEAAIKSIHDSRDAGFENISIDLIYAIPAQDDDQWKKNIETALTLNPDHISSYSLTIEDQTVFGKWRKQKKLYEVEEPIAAHQLEILIDKLSDSGFEHYEVSNFCKPDFHSRHNSSYWKQVPYLGVGPGAHSYNLTSRQCNISNNSLYIKSLDDGKIPCELELLTRENKINEYIFTTLRTCWGCDLDRLKNKFKYDLQVVHAAQLQSYLELGYGTIDGSIFKLTKKGMLIADKISSDLFIDS